MNTLKPSTPMDLYGERRQEIKNANSGLNQLEESLRKYENPEMRSPVPGEATSQDFSEAQAEAPSGSSEETDERKGFLQHALDVASFVTKPLSVFGAGIAPLTHDYESEGFWGKSGEAFTVVGEEIRRRLLPTYGENDEFHGQEIVNQMAPDAPDWVKSSGGMALEFLLDPAMTAGLGTIKSVQAGLRIGNMQTKAMKGTQSLKGVMAEGVQEFLNFGKGFDANEITELGALAKKVDAGGDEGKKAFKELSKRLDEDPRILEAVKKADDKDVNEAVRHQRAILGNPKGDLYEVKNKVDGVELLSDKDFRRTLDSNIQYRSMEINLSKISSLEDVNKLATDATQVYETEYNKAMGISRGKPKIRKGTKKGEGKGAFSPNELPPAESYIKSLEEIESLKEEIARGYKTKGINDDIAENIETLDMELESFLDNFMTIRELNYFDAVDFNQGDALGYLKYVKRNLEHGSYPSLEYIEDGIVNEIIFEKKSSKGKGALYDMVHNPRKFKEGGPSREEVRAIVKTQIEAYKDGVLDYKNWEIKGKLPFGKKDDLRGFLINFFKQEGGDISDWRTDPMFNSQFELDKLLKKEGTQVSATASKSTAPYLTAEEATRTQNGMLMDLVGRKTKPFAPKQAYGLRQLLITSGDQLKSRATLAEGSLDKLHEVAFEKAAAVHDALLALTTGGSTEEATKLLKAYAIKGKSGRGQVKDIENILSGFGATRHGKKLLKHFLMAADDPRKVSRLMEKSVADKTADVAFEIFTNMILSGPLTHAKNITTNGFLVALRPTEKMLAAMSATARLDFHEAHTHLAEATAMVHGVLQAIGDGLRLTFYGDEMAVKTPEVLEKMHEIAKQKIRPALSSKALGAQGKLGQAIDYLGSGLRLPGNTLLAEDKAFKVLNYRMTVNAEAARAAMKGNTKGDRHAIYKAMQYNPNENVVKKAVDSANYYTFTNELGSFGRTMSRLVHKPVVRYVVPFFKSPINIGKVGVRHSVLGNMVKDLPNAYKLSAEGDMARAKIALGTLIPAALLMNLDENITGHIDQSTALGRFRVQNKEMPYSAKLDDKWYSFEGIEPIRSVIGILMSVKEIFENIEFIDPETGKENPIVEDVFLASIGPFIETVGDNFMVPAFGKINLMLEGMASGNPKFMVQQFKKTMAAMTVPNALRQFNNQYMDSTYRRTQTYLDMVKQGIPGLSKTLPPVLTFWADEVVVPHGLGLDILSPIRTATREPDYIDNEILRLKVSIPSRPKQISPVPGEPTVPLDPYKQAEFQRLRGKGLAGGPSAKETIAEFVDGDDYEMLPDEVKKDMIEYLMRQVTEATKQFMFSIDTELQEEFKHRMEAKQRSMSALKQ